MSNEPGKAARHTMTLDKRGGYGSSSKQVSKLTTPPRGPAPGASSNGTSSTAQK